MNITDTFYVALCMTILILGVVYWFWTQTQYMQRKLNLLENIVFEIKTQIQKGDDSSPNIPPNMVIMESGSYESKYPPAPSSELGEDDDLLEEEIESESISNTTMEQIAQIAQNIQNIEVLDSEKEHTIESDVHEEQELSASLQPGGVGSGIQAVPEPDSTAKGSVLEGMTLKELQRLAEQKGINTSRLRKPQLIESIRAHSRPLPFQTSSTTLELS